MVTRMLMVAMLAAGAAEAAPAGPPSSASGLSSGASAVAIATATIRHPVVLRGDAVAPGEPGLPPLRGRARSCDMPEGSAPECRLVVYDIP